MEWVGSCCGSGDRHEVDAEMDMVWKGRPRPRDMSVNGESLWCGSREGHDVEGQRGILFKGKGT